MDELLFIIEKNIVTLSLREELMDANPPPEQEEEWPKQAPPLPRPGRQPPDQQFRAMSLLCSSFSDLG